MPNGYIAVRTNQKPAPKHEERGSAVVVRFDVEKRIAYLVGLEDKELFESTGKHMSKRAFNARSAEIRVILTSVEVAE